MIAPRYVQEFVEPYLITYVRTLLNSIFQHDNSLSHVTRLTMGNFEVVEINLLPWPPSLLIYTQSNMYGILWKKNPKFKQAPQSVVAFRHELKIKNIT